MHEPNQRACSFTEFFNAATGWPKPYNWQLLVALDGLPDVLSVPTGLGKTEVALAWAWRLLIDKQKGEPLHLVVCLPMRSLVTQTAQRLKAYFDAVKVKKPARAEFIKVQPQAHSLTDEARRRGREANLADAHQGGGL